MFDWTHLFLFGIAAGAVIIAPGPDILYVLSRSISNGRRAGLASGLGIGMGEVIQSILSALGLAAILSASVTAFLIIKYAGAVYLLYLGWKTIRDRKPFAAEASAARLPVIPVIWQGMLTNLLNPKAILFYVAFLPQFTNPKAGNASLQILILGLLFALFDLGFLCILTFLSGSIHGWLMRRPGNRNILRWLSGGTLIGLGARLFFTERG